VKKSLKTKIRNISKSDFKRLSELTHFAKNLYNQALWIIKKELKETNIYLSYGKMDKIMKSIQNLEEEINYKKLKAGVSQQILRRIHNNYLSFFKAIKDWKQNPEKYLGMPKPPKFKKDNHANLIYDSQRFQVKNNKAFLEKELFIEIPKDILDKKIIQIEIIPKYGYFEAVFIFEEEKEYLQVLENKNVVGIDLGLDNLATVVSNGKLKPFIINGKQLKSINQFYNKTKAKYQSRLDIEGEKNGLKDYRKLLILEIIK
jgi:putative transposase